MNKTENKTSRRVLVITGGGKQFSGIDNYLCTQLSRIDRKRIHLDFLFCGVNSFAHHPDAFAQEDANYDVLNLFSTGLEAGLKKWLQFMPKLNRYMKQHPGYDVVHIIVASEYITALCALVMKWRHIPVRMGHSQNTMMPKGHRDGLREVVKACLRAPSRLVNRVCLTDYLACSEEAGIHMFGRRVLKSDRYRVLKNAIETSEFRFSPQTRTAIRAQEHIAEKTSVFCFTGRLVEQKNPRFLVDIYRELHQRRPDSVLWIVGSGALRDELEQRIASYGLTDSVKLWGDRSDVADIMQAADAFVFPSLYEGLGIVAVEAQTAGLPVYTSTEVPEEARVTDLIEFIPLSQSAAAWAEQILKGMAGQPARRDHAAEVAAHGYDAAMASAELQALYLR